MYKIRTAELRLIRDYFYFTNGKSISNGTKDLNQGPPYKSRGRWYIKRVKEQSFFVPKEFL